MAKGKEVILLGHSLAGTVVSGYMALSEVTKPTATVILAPGQFLNPGQTDDEINRANELIASGDGDVYTNFLTAYFGGTTKTISSTPRIYLSYHTTTTFIDTGERKFAVTNDHVFETFERIQKNNSEENFTQFLLMMKILLNIINP